MFSYSTIVDLRVFLYVHYIVLNKNTVYDKCVDFIKCEGHSENNTTSCNIAL